jgi:hypothetical protein
VASGEKTKVEVKNGGKRRSGEESRIKYEASKITIRTVCANLVPISLK